MPPAVSIVCWTYNHAHFVSEAIESFLRQETSFPVEIIMHDDASKDGTKVILQEYEKNYPLLFRNIYQNKNLFQRGLDINGPPYAQARGEFIAICEGDDYWVCADKLEQQVAFLRKNPGCVGSFHRGYAIDDSGARQPFIWDNYPYKSRYTQEECLFELFSGYPTAALMFRKSSLKFPFPKYFLEQPTDFTTDIMITESGDLGFLDFEGATYRQHSGGLWSNLSLASMQMEVAGRLISLHKDVSLRKRFTRLESHLIRQLDVTWWLLFQEYGESLKAWVISTASVCKTLISSNFRLIPLWLLRNSCPIKYKLRDVLNPMAAGKK